MDFIEEPELQIKVEKEDDDAGIELNQDSENFQCYLCQERFTNDLEMIQHQFLHSNDDFTYDMVLFNESCKFQIKYLEENGNGEEQEEEERELETPPPRIILPAKPKQQNGIGHTQVAPKPAIQQSQQQKTLLQQRLQQKPQQQQLHLQNPLLHNRLKTYAKPSNENRVTLNLNPLYTPENTVKCGRCPRIFLTKEELMEHQVVHYHKCKKCGDKFPELMDLQEHMTNHHKQEKSSTTAKCNQCNEIFTSVQELLVHSLTHTKTLLPKRREMKCGECNREFTKPSQLRNHLYVHMPEAERPHKCESCEKSFGTISILKKHKLIHLPKAHKCEECGKYFSRPTHLRDHSFIHKPGYKSSLRQQFIDQAKAEASEKPYECEECKKRFGTATELKSHSYVHKSPEERPHKCPHCDKCYTKAANLRQHISANHLNENPENESIVKLEKEDSDSSSSIVVSPSKQEVIVGNKMVYIPRKITITPPKSLLQANLQKTMQTNGGIRVAPAHFLMQPSSSNLTVDKKRRYQCPSCDKCFNRSDHLKRHSITHVPLDKRPFKCNVCNRSFLQVEELKAHNATHTPDPSRPHSCEVCGKCFGTKTHLTQHMAFHRPAEERYRCPRPDCNDSFGTSLDLKKHHYYHKHMAANNKMKAENNLIKEEDAGDDEYSNDEEMSDNNNESIYTTVKANYSPTSHKYQCVECKISFTTQGLLEAHKNIHDPLSEAKTYNCQLCSKVFGKAQNLRKHQLVHSNDYPFECDECFKKFKEKKSLTRHKLIHSDIREFKCPVCPRDFHRKDYLKNHMITHNRSSLS